MSGADVVRLGSLLFLTAAPDLAPGDELASGHWGPEVMRWPLARLGTDGESVLEQDTIHVLLELTWEMVRLREFPQQPCRLDSLFLWADEGAARAWHYRKHVLNSSSAGLYEVEVTDCQRVLAADMNPISHLDAGDTLAVLVERARGYWRGEIGDVTPEVLLEGRVVVRRSLLAVPLEALTAVKDHEMHRAVPTAVHWSTEVASWSLTAVNEKRWHLQGALTADACLPVSVAGWLALEVQGQKELVRARWGTPPVLLKPDGGCRVSAMLADHSPLPDGTRCRPVLVCDRAAAHYWQLQPYWEGQLWGDWLAV